jgi:cardiolipin synthase A/B
VKIYERRTGIMYAKTMVIGGVWSLVGSSNFDQQSVLFNDEVDAVALGREAADQLQKGMESDMQHAQWIDSKFVHQQGIWQQTKAWFWRL